MKAVLVLEDGNSFEGVSAGISEERIGEAVLNTAVVGYQEIMTDSANAGKILIMTYPLIGNYGVASKFYETTKCWVRGLVIKEASRTYSNWQAEGSFANFLKKEAVTAISDVDTRTLAVNIRDNGEMLGIISSGNFRKPDLLKKLRNHKKSRRIDFLKSTSVKKITEIKTSPSGPKIAVLDLGIANSFIKQLRTLGCNIELLPYDTDAEKILAMRPAGLVISNGPEADISLPVVAQNVKKLIGKIPMLGISAGHEVIVSALGGSVKKMKVGHHGVNYPIKAYGTYKGEITVQNHSYVADEASLRGNKDIEITMRNLNDNSVEEIESSRLRLISAQYYPASPGFEEVNEVFVRFLRMASGAKRPVKNKHHPKTSDEVHYAKA